MTLIPVAARLWPNDLKIDAATTAERVQRYFPHAEIDWKRGDEAVYRGIDQLRESDMPDFYIEAKRKSLGQVAYISLQDAQFPGLTGWFYASRIERELGDCFDLYSEPAIDIPFLKYLAAQIATRIGFSYLFSTDSTWGIGMRSEPQRCDPVTFARGQLPERNYPELSLRPLADWRGSLTKAVPLWFEQATWKSKQDMIDRCGSVSAISANTAEVLIEIGGVRAAWLVDVPAPFYNGLIVEHDGWMSYVSLSGAPKGILV